ncbi:MAG: SCO family protein [Pseudomonadales bacterium]|nr:SCO family protein [Pseudomonadales bacterium]
MKSSLLILLVYFILGGCDKNQLDHDGLEMDFEASIEALKSAGFDQQGTPQAGLPYVRHLNLDVTWDADDKDIIQLPDFSFTNQFNATISRESIRDKIILANFFYGECHGMCPLIMRNMQKIAKDTLTLEDVVILSHTLTPAEDNADKLAKIGAMYGAKQDRWHLVTGNKDEIYSLARDTYHADVTKGVEKKRDSQFRHSEHIYLMDMQGRVRGMYNGKDPSAINRVLKDLRRLLK